MTTTTLNSTTSNPTSPSPMVNALEHIDAPDPQSRYVQPGWFTKQIFNRLMRRLTRVGVSLRGSRELRVRGRSSGEWRTVPVNPLTIGSVKYLVAPRGTTDWVRNLRVAGNGELRIGSRIEPFTARELADADKPEILREYLRRWKAEVGIFFDGVGPDASSDELAAIAPGYPVFAIETFDAAG